ncbi:DUF58 domain-containing protein [Proteiniborus sp. MB09-C3]|uniref:DUF58 domain-containing protein n=1 Tax=Proteiniborus sp. MB09-C3 TaxID=3050072 RepID=UPI0025564691|nr:DUF58 domain-containing protein [Proteiniborus sp. MB09-C3]WIV13743.1 DUF58 domain-containing protein [Proteiniborus sp. MB09-C3]
MYIRKALDILKNLKKIINRLIFSPEAKIKKRNAKDVLKGILISSNKMSKFKIGFLLIFLTIFIFVLLVGGTIPYFLFYIFLLTFLIPLIYNLVILMNLKGYIRVPSESLFAGGSIILEYEVKNDSIFHIPYLEIHSNISKQLIGNNSPIVALSLEKKGTFAHSETITLKRRGYYELEEMIVTVHDVLGFYSFKKKISSTTSILVYPKATKLSTFKITSSHQSGEALIQNTVFQDKSRIASLREYKEGDSVKAIHWKLTAKKDIPIIREYENYGDTYATIFIDNESKHYKRDVNRHIEDKAASAALSIINYCLDQGIDVSLETQDAQKYIQIQGQQKSDYKPFLEALARFKGNGAIDFKSLLITRIETLKKNSTVIIITPNFDKEMGTLGIQLKMRNFNPLFILITDMENSMGYIDREIEIMLRRENIPIYILDHNTNIREALEVYNV